MDKLREIELTHLIIYIASFFSAMNGINTVYANHLDSPADEISLVFNIVVVILGSNLYIETQQNVWLIACMTMLFETGCLISVLT